MVCVMLFECIKNDSCVVLLYLNGLNMCEVDFSLKCYIGLRTKMVLMLWNDVSLRTRMTLKTYTLYSNSALPFLNRTALTPFWLSTDLNQLQTITAYLFLVCTSDHRHDIQCHQQAEPGSEYFTQLTSTS